MVFFEIGKHKAAESAECDGDDGDQKRFSYKVYQLLSFLQFTSLVMKLASYEILFPL
jgi:hypothetical protein